MVIPFLTLHQLSVLFSKPSAVLMQNAEVPRSAVEQFLQNDEEEEQCRILTQLAEKQPGLFKNVA